MGMPESKYGIPFPVLARTSFGVFGANVPALLRGIVAIVWLGIQAYSGSAAFNIAFTLLWPGWAKLGGDWSFIGINLPGLLSFLIFWGVHFLILKRGMESLKKFQAYAGPIVYIVLIGVLWWAIDAAGGLKEFFLNRENMRPLGLHYFHLLLQ